MNFFDLFRKKEQTITAKNENLPEIIREDFIDDTDPMVEKSNEQSDFFKYPIDEI